MTSSIHGGIRVKVEKTHSQIGIIYTDGIVFRNRENAVFLAINSLNKHIEIKSISHSPIRLFLILLYLHSTPLTPKLSTAVTVLL